MSEKKRKQRSGLRGAARLYAVQILYRSTMGHQSLRKLIDESSAKDEIFISENVSIFDMDHEFFTNLLMATEQHIVEVDEIIRKHLSENWSLDRIDSVIVCVFRLAITEIICFKNTPINVILNEYVEIAKAFFGKPQVSFVNGLLHSVANDSEVRVSDACP
ncbi:MAG: transcription antitermination factor NusB [Holosporaceae bacterium]|nr:transcription antitermination factor NusB [Holosporaceae bacterium]